MTSNDVYQMHANMYLLKEKYKDTTSISDDVEITWLAGQCRRVHSSISTCFQHENNVYPLVNIQKAIENGHL